MRIYTRWVTARIITVPASIACRGHFLVSVTVTILGVALGVVVEAAADVGLTELGTTLNVGLTLQLGVSVKVGWVLMALAMTGETVNDAFEVVNCRESQIPCQPDLSMWET